MRIKKKILERYTEDMVSKIMTERSVYIKMACRILNGVKVQFTSLAMRATLLDPAGATKR